MIRTAINVTFLTAAVTAAHFTLPTCDAAGEVTQQALKILERRCLSCHNDVDRKGDLSLETQGAVRAAAVIDDELPLDSPLLTAVSPVDGESPAMPKNADPLTDTERRILRQWIVQGAKWPKDYRLKPTAAYDFDWWSFQSLRRPDIPQFDADSAEARWIRNPIDAFIAAKHVEQGLTHSDPADRRTLIRRLYYDLTGLPPSPEAVQDFMHDTDPGAWDLLIEKLLDSDGYGERWARHWLDVVKYADTCGYDKDKLRPNAWPYRDYVIESFNADKPYSQFVQEQIAGDILFPGTADGIRALGFIAAGPWDFIGHAEVSEDRIDGQVARNLDRDDMVSNTLNTFCSLTVQCARCHNHKFDPFTQEHYYSLQSVFAAVDKADRPFNMTPESEQQYRSLTARHDQARKSLRALQKEIRTAGGDELKQAQELAGGFEAGRREQLRPPQYGYHSQIETNADIEKWVEVDLGRVVSLKEVRLRACADDFSDIGAGFGFPLRFHVEVSTSPIDDSSKTRLVSFEAADVTNPRLAPLRIPANDLAVRFIRVTATRLAVRRKDYIFALSELEAIDNEGVNVALHSTVTAKDSFQAPVRWAKANLTDGLFPVARDPEAAERLLEAEIRLAGILAGLQTAEWKSRRREFTETIENTQQELNDLPQRKMVYAAATHFKTRGKFKPTKGRPRTVRVLHRGNVTQPLEEVTPGVVPLSSDADWHVRLDPDHTEADRRAALAHWLSDKSNPLTWRSVVNRIWQYHFGLPIVSTPNDFGRMGQLPTHPELLDWLATEFRDNGQSFKHLHRLILRSAVWQQASAHHDGHAQIDSSNRFLWRQSRRRLSAEELRDSVLAVSGRLNPAMGGPGFYLFALEKTEHSPHYEYHKFDPADESSHRRSVYRFIVRSQPDPFMTTLDCADSSQSTPRRTETFTPLQALSLMNNDFTLVMAESFSMRLQQDFDKVSDAVHYAFQLCTGRHPADAEHTALVNYTEEYGTAALARLLFNLNEFVFVD
ncbi:MAG: PSD1 and planctomycete cytochrome C domain-containing protein [Fuerstiella sp.]|nr:PSD1 and planctomycete cytochrome C domain-containing protein [Fuerstiella sp.]